MKSRFLAAFALLAIGVVLCFLVFSHRFVILTLNRSATIELHDALINGELLEGRATAVVTTRGPGKSHSYRLFFAGDTDFTGDMGFVVDCNQWVAPHLPILPETMNYPPCKRVSGTRRWPLFNKGKAMEFVLEDGSTVRIKF